jgi:hypothetical protein
MAADPTLVALWQEVHEGARSESWAVINELAMRCGRIFLSASSLSL